MNDYPSPAELLRRYKLQAKKGFGQNFLTDKNVTSRIAAAVHTEDTTGSSPSTRRGTVIEIGPGLGALTTMLLERCERVIAVERDPDMVRVLEAEFADARATGDLTMHCTDALTVHWGELLAGCPEPHAVVGNLPYLVTGRFLERAVELAEHVPRILFMVQKEVGERLLAAPGTKEYGALTVFVAASFDVSRVMIVKGGAFLPKPNVDSMVVRLDRRSERVLESHNFRMLVKTAFGQRRKTLRNAWAGTHFGADLIARASAAAGIDLMRRGETLSLHDFRRVELELERLQASEPAP